MSREQLSRPMFWLGILFILGCLAFATYARAEPQPCQEELNTVKQVCRKKGKRSYECRRAIDDYKMCKAVEGGNDPLEGLK